MRNLLKLSLLAAGAACLSAPAMAVTMVPNGTVTVSALYNPAVNLATSPATYTATMGPTFEVNGTGGFSAVGGLTGTMNGTLSFLSTVGSTIPQTVANFFVFNDGVGGTYNFSVASVSTMTYAVTPNVSSSVSLYLLGTTLDTFQGYGATPTSLTLSFNKTGVSAYSASATLAIPPSGAVPEPASWAMMLGGFGLIGGAMRRHKVGISKAKVGKVSYAA